jgi:Ser/Thr protein kinase RdoA (MazF antagonist)
MSWNPHEPQIIIRFAREWTVRRGWTMMGCEPWKEGASNAIWALDTDHGRYILKIGKLEYWRRLPVEGEVLRLLEGEDAPRLVDTGTADETIPWDWSVLERVEGIHPFGLSPEQAFGLGELLARVRKKAAGTAFENGTWRHWLDNRVRGAVALALPQAPAPIGELFEKYLDRVERCARFGDILDTLPGGITHCDITPYNLILKPDGSFCLLDWEYPRTAPAVWDLACIRKAFRLEPEGFRELCRGLGESFPDEALAFADILYQLQVCSWRAEMMYGRGKHDYGDFFIVEMGEELARVEMLLRGLL